MNQQLIPSRRLSRKQGQITPENVRYVLKKRKQQRKQENQAIIVMTLASFVFVFLIIFYNAEDSSLKRLFYCLF